MSVQRLGALFRASPAPSNVNVADITPSVASTTQWTQGATIIDQIQLRPGLNDRWSIIAVSITAYLVLSVQSPPTAPPTGKLGKLIGALLPQGQTATATGIVPYVNMLPLPLDASLSVTLWDGAQDSCPPIVPILTQPPGMPVYGTFSPPNPVDVDPNAQLCIGMWLTPSLVSGGFSVHLNVQNASYSVAYDDGNPPRTGWGDQ